MKAPKQKPLNMQTLSKELQQWKGEVRIAQSSANRANERLDKKRNTIRNGIVSGGLAGLFCAGLFAYFNGKR